jgi:leucyl aminopeptidase
MKIRLLTSATSPAKECLLGLAYEGKNPDLGDTLQAMVKVAKKTGDLDTSDRATSVFYPAGKGLPLRIGFVGAGNRRDVTAEKLRRAAAVAQKLASSHKAKTFRFVLHEDDHKGIEAGVAGRAVAEGIVLGAYKYKKPSGTKAPAQYANSAEIFYTGRDVKGFRAGVQTGRIGAEATVFARDIENLPGNKATPRYLASQARKFKSPGLSVRIMAESEMRKHGMNALLGVSRGSREPAKMILMDYKPKGYKSTVCVVGKGLTFDTGGISIKPSANMGDMRYDMCGGGAVLGLFHAIANGGMKGASGKVRVVGVVPSSENMPDGDAQKPGDVVAACDGTTIEIINTDAEGRLILADALAYAKKTYKPDCMIDLATLTGAVVVALGHEMAGIMGSDDDLIHDLIEAGQESDEPLWQLPLWDVHREQIKGQFADVNNLNSPAYGNGSTSGGAFLSYFTKGVRWAHIDIAGAAWGATAKDYYASGAVGTAVRTLLHWVRGLK